MSKNIFSKLVAAKIDFIEKDEDHDEWISEVEKALANTFELGFWAAIVKQDGSVSLFDQVNKKLVDLDIICGVASTVAEVTASNDYSYEKTAEPLMEALTEQNKKHGEKAVVIYIKTTCDKNGESCVTEHIRCHGETYSQ